MQKICLTFFSLLFIYCCLGQGIDVQHYTFSLQLTDAHDSIQGQAKVQIKFLQPLIRFELDLVQARNGKGMHLKQVTGRHVNSFAAAEDKIVITLHQPAQTDSLYTFLIRYSGVPADGLIISKNKYGDRTFFADNWPNRARHWLPCNDRPDDKASVEFVVTAPAHYQVISNGMLMEETNLTATTTQTHWKETIPIPTKVMVMGAARFAVGRIDSSFTVPVTAWVYPQDREKGFYDYAVTPGIVQFFSAYIGPYPFQKLANVQSKTIFGGMENASAIFYAENTVTGNRTAEDLMAHEIAHQWFGNMATEKSFAHLWLSEGFATYLTNVYLEYKYGKEALQKRMQEQRNEVLQFNRRSNTPVVDSVSALMDLLNANSYQKGSWVLHMLRGEVGDAVFQKIIQTYYAQYEGRNAETRDFQQIAGQVSGKDVGWFFNQWLYQPGYPKLQVKWKWAGNQLRLSVQQTGRQAFRFPLEVALVDAAGRTTVQKVEVTAAQQTFEVPAAQKPARLVLDPNTALLFEGSVVQDL